MVHGPFLALGALALATCGCGAASGSLPTVVAGTVVEASAGAEDEEFGQIAHVETDNELPFRESLGEDGIDGPFTGPSNNGLIGLGAVGAFDGRERPGENSAHHQGLQWLAARQAPDGGWDEAWRDGDTRSHDPALTGRALLAFLGAGYTNRGNHDFAKTVARGLRYLKNVQDAEGWYVMPGDEHRGPRLEDHVFACAAMVEAYGMTESPIFRASAVRALEALALACANGDSALADRQVAHGALQALLAARLVDENQRARGRKPRLAFDRERFAPLERYRWGADARADVVDVALAVLARRVFAEEDDPSLEGDLDRLLSDLVSYPFAWASWRSEEAPATWLLLRVAVDGDDCYASEATRHRWRQTMKDEIERYREASLAAMDLRGSWDPASLPGYRGTRLRLAVFALGAL